MRQYKRCCFCGIKMYKIEEYNNPSPLGKEGDVCCCDCNDEIVIPVRIKNLMVRVRTKGMEV